MTCIIVRLGEYEKYDSLKEVFRHGVPIVWDRRCNSEPITYSERDSSDSISNRRRKPPTSWTAHGFVVVDGPD